MNGMIVGILLALLIVIIGFFAYTQGYFTAQVEEEQQQGLNIEIGGSN